MNLTEIPVPKALRDRPKLKGFPLPFVADNPDGASDFRVLVPSRWLDCVAHRLCALCGKTMKGDVVFIGGPKTRQTLIFIDPGMHEECARYARKVCPYLAFHDRNYREANLPEHITVVAVSSKKPDELIMMWAKSYRLTFIGHQEAIEAVNIVREEHWKP